MGCWPVFTGFPLQAIVPKLSCMSGAKQFTLAVLLKHRDAVVLLMAILLRSKALEALEAFSEVVGIRISA